MTPDEIQRLRDLASAATPGPWRHRADHPCCDVWSATRCVAVVGDSATEPDAGQEAVDAEYLAALPPEVVLRLLDRAELVTDCVECDEPMIGGSVCYRCACG